MDEKIKQKLDYKEEKFYTVEQLIERLKIYNPKSYVGMSIPNTTFHPLNIINDLFSSSKFFTIIENKREYAREIKTVNISLPEINCNVDYDFEN